MARAPSAGGKSRLAAVLSADAVRTLRAALLADALAVAQESGFPVHVFVEPATALDEVRAFVPGLRCTPQRGEDLGARMANALADLLGAGHDAAIVIGTDIPQLTPDDLRSAAELVSEDVLVLGPATDGGYYLLASATSDPALFARIEWGSGHVCRDTIVRAESAGLDVALLRKLNDLDTRDDLDSIQVQLATQPPDVARAFRAWLGVAASNGGDLLKSRTDG